MLCEIRPAKTVTRALLSAGVLALGFSIQSDPASSGTVSEGDPSAAPAQTQPFVPKPPEAEVRDGAIGTTPKAAAAEAGSPAAPTVMSADQVRAAMDEAQKRRDSLRQPDAAVADAEVHKELLDKWGVEVMGIRLAARGYMMDFRFKVQDLEKALPLFDSRIKPYVIPEGTEVKLPVPAGQKVGAFRTTNRGKNIQAGKDYVIMFGNPDSFVKPGQKVSVVIGDFRVERLTVK
jgi:hypothetical protein